MHLRDEYPTRALQHRVKSCETGGVLVSEKVVLNMAALRNIKTSAQ